MRNDTTLTNLSRGTQERIAHLLALQGKTQAQVNELHAGDLGAIAKLKDAQTGDTLSDKATDLTLATDRVRRAVDVLCPRTQVAR